MFARNLFSGKRSEPKQVLVWWPLKSKLIKIGDHYIMSHKKIEMLCLLLLLTGCASTVSRQPTIDFNKYLQSATETDTTITAFGIGENKIEALCDALDDAGFILYWYIRSNIDSTSNGKISTLHFSSFSIGEVMISSIYKDSSYIKSDTTLFESLNHYTNILYSDLPTRKQLTIVKNTITEGLILEEDFSNRTSYYEINCSVDDLIKELYNNKVSISFCNDDKNVFVELTIDKRFVKINEKSDSIFYSNELVIEADIYYKEFLRELMQIRARKFYEELEQEILKLKE